LPAGEAHVAGEHELVTDAARAAANLRDAHDWRGRQAQHKVAPKAQCLWPFSRLGYVEMGDEKIGIRRLEHHSLYGRVGLVPNPLEQARQYSHAVIEVLRRDAQLTNPAGSPYEGRLTFPYGYGVVLTNITRNQFDGSGLADILPSHLIIYKDEMTESAEAEELIMRCVVDRAPPWSSVRRR
jgi:hypothetical protein